MIIVPRMSSFSPIPRIRTWPFKEEHKRNYKRKIIVLKSHLSNFHCKCPKYPFEKFYLVKILKIIPTESFLNNAITYNPCTIHGQISVILL